MSFYLCYLLRTVMLIVGNVLLSYYCFNEHYRFSNVEKDFLIRYYYFSMSTSFKDCWNVYF